MSEVTVELNQAVRECLLATRTDLVRIHDELREIRTSVWDAIHAELPQLTIDENHNLAEINGTLTVDGELALSEDIRPGYRSLRLCKAKLALFQQFDESAMWGTIKEQFPELELAEVNPSVKVEWSETEPLKLLCAEICYEK